LHLKRTVVSVQIGAVARLADLLGNELESAIAKHVVSGTVAVRRDGLDGDEHGDRRNHGGAEKAVCAYPVEHYPYWAERLRRPLVGGAFGENLTVRGLTEAFVCIGDVLAVGTAVLQVSQPRQPCYRLASFYGIRELALWLQQAGMTGFYCRVLAPGELTARCSIELIERPHPSLTLEEANHVMHADLDDLAALRRLMVPELSERWRDTIARRLRGERNGTERRLYGK
jgi:MOSC domain-containing protein YiiM